MTLITLDQLIRIVPNAKRIKLELYYPFLLEALEEYHINTLPRIAAFLAQLVHESGSFKYMEELASGKAYDNRKDLGNLEKEAIEVAHANHSTPGVWFKGHGPIQITGYYNHLKCGKALGLDLVKHPRLICEPENAFRSSGWFWESHKCNTYADIKEFNKVSKIINCGNANSKIIPNGKADRDTNYTLACLVLHV